MDWSTDRDGIVVVYNEQKTRVFDRVQSISTTNWSNLAPIINRHKNTNEQSGRTETR